VSVAASESSEASPAARRITRRILERLVPENSDASEKPITPATPPLPPGERLPPIADRNVFIIEAYRVVLRRDPTQEEVTREARLLRFLPYIYTRSRFLARLRGSFEAIVLENRDRAARAALDALRFAALEREHEKIEAQLKVLQRSLSAVSYGIVDEIIEGQRRATASDRPVEGGP
jgi:hypothetical protein